MGALGYFQSRVQQIVNKHGKSAMFWDEFWAADLPALNSTVAEIRGSTFDQLLSQARPCVSQQLPSPSVDFCLCLCPSVLQLRYWQSVLRLFGACCCGGFQCADNRH